MMDKKRIRKTLNDAVERYLLGDVDGDFRFNYIWTVSYTHLGSPNYVREYYWSSGSLRYRDTYVNIQVNQYHHIFKVSDTLTYIVVVLMGGCLICLWRKSSR